jgi:uncharacterized protein
MWIPERITKDELGSFKRPFHTFLFKVATRCNLNCSYCYVYQSPDKSWLEKEKFMSEKVVLQTAIRINEHVKRHNLKSISINFHGGEPLLWKYEIFYSALKIIGKTISCKIDYGIQTNGILLTNELIVLFNKYNIKMGISNDGPKIYNDIDRVYHNNKGSFDDVMNGYTLLRNSKHYDNVFGGFLYVVNLEHEPRIILEHFKKIGAKSFNILLPDKHHDTKIEQSKKSFHKTYAKWLNNLFELWFEKFQEIEIPYFEEIINLMLGGISTSEELGAKSVDLIVVETDGTIEPVDTLKIVGRDATNLKMDVFKNSFDQVIETDPILSRMSGYSVLSDKCKKCNYLNTCGGGYLPHRYSEENGFINPSVYCDDLISLFDTVKKTLQKLEVL